MKTYILTDTHASYRIIRAETSKDALEKSNGNLGKRWRKAKLMPPRGTVTEVLYAPAEFKKATKSNDGHYYGVSWLKQSVNKKTGQPRYQPVGGRKLKTLGAARKLAAEWARRDERVIITEHVYDIALTAHMSKVFSI